MGLSKTCIQECSVNLLHSAVHALLGARADVVPCAMEERSAPASTITSFSAVLCVLCVLCPQRSVIILVHLPSIYIMLNGSSARLQ
jgi:hypothetical protein